MNGPRAVLALLVLSVTSVSAQTAGQAGGALLVERYTFDAGLPYSAVTELSLPVTFSAALSPRSSLTVSGGLTRITLTGADDTVEDLELTGLVDTEARLVLGVVPDRLSVLLTAVLPTGTESLELDESPILTALSSQVVGFSTTSLGSGGRAGVGLVASLPAGDMAVGLAGSYTHSLAYGPVVGQPGEWRPGGQIRLRAGLEGAVGPRTYLRLSSIVLVRQKDQVDGVDLGRTGNQVHAYVSINHGLEVGSLTLYAMDSFRSAPQVEATAVGAALLPRGNLLAVGGRLELPVGGNARVVPRVEFRRLSEAARGDAVDESLQAAGSTLRVGADFRLPVRNDLAVVLEGNGLFGNVGDGAGSTVGVRGFRAGIHLALRR